MPDMRTSRFFPVAILAVVLSAMAGGALGGSLMARQDEVANQYKIFTSALDAIARSTSTSSRRIAWSTAPSTAC